MILFLNYLSIFCLFFGGFFIFASFIGLIRYKDFYIKLHTLTMFNVYGASLILFSVSILSYEPIIFFEILFLIVINSICSIAITSFLLKNAILNDILYNAKSRDEIIQEENEEIYNKTRDFIDKKEKLKQKEEKEKIIQKEEKEKIKQKEEKKTNLQKQEDKKVQQQSKEQQPQPQQQPKEQPKEQPKPKEEMTDIERENEELRQKIKEQKKILRKKIETVRKNAFITRKPEEIQKAEDLIKSILDKYHLTEEMLADDYEDDF